MSSASVIDLRNASVAGCSGGLASLLLRKFLSLLRSEVADVAGTVKRKSVFRGEGGGAKDLLLPPTPPPIKHLNARIFKRSKITSSFAV